MFYAIKTVTLYPTFNSKTRCIIINIANEMNLEKVTLQCILSYTSVPLYHRVPDKYRLGPICQFEFRS